MAAYRTIVRVGVGSILLLFAQLFAGSPGVDAQRPAAAPKGRRVAAARNPAPAPDQLVLTSEARGADVFILLERDLPDPPWRATWDTASTGKTPLSASLGPGAYYVLLRFPTACLADFPDDRVDGAVATGRLESFDRTGKPESVKGWRLYKVAKEAGTSASLSALCLTPKSSLEQLDRFYPKKEGFSVADEMAGRLIEHGASPADAATAIRLLRRGGKVWLTASDGGLVGARVKDGMVVVGRFDAK